MYSCKLHAAPVNLLVSKVNTTLTQCFYITIFKFKFSTTFYVENTVPSEGTDFHGKATISYKIIVLIQKFWGKCTTSNLS